MPSIDDLRKIAEVEFADIVRDSLVIDHKLRIFLINNGFIDVSLSRLSQFAPKKGRFWAFVSRKPLIFLRSISKTACSADLPS